MKCEAKGFAARRKNLHERDIIFIRFQLQQVPGSEEKNNFHQFYVLTHIEKYKYA